MSKYESVELPVSEAPQDTARTASPIGADTALPEETVMVPATDLESATASYLAWLRDRKGGPLTDAESERIQKLYEDGFKFYRHLKKRSVHPDS